MTNDLTSKPIPSLIKGIAVPASIGFIFNTLYNIVDSWFAGFISTQALAAIGLSFPVFFCIIAFGLGIATGSTAILSNALGENNQDDAELFATQVMTFGVILSVILTILGLWLSPSLFRLLGATDEYLAISLSYMNIIIVGTLLFMGNFILNSILQAHGDTRSFRNFLILGFFLNFLFNPMFMYGWLWLPAMGIAGIAFATVLIQFIGLIYMIWKISRLGLFCRRCLKRIPPNKKAFLEISKQGFPASVNTMTVALGIFIITFFVKDFGKSAVAAYGVTQRIEQLAMLPLMGLRIAALAMVGQNNGAGKYDRVKETIRTTLKYGVFFMSIGAVVMFIVPGPLMSFFTEDQEVISIGIVYLRIAAFISWGYVILGQTVAALQGIKKPMFAVWIGFYRQIVGPLLIFYVVRGLLGLGIISIWWSIFFLVWSSSIIALMFLKNTLRRLMNSNNPERPSK
ncbi:MATE family efflux transporter [Thermodesulfobacteriota bacterium]